VRDFYQGVLQVAVALHHWRNGNYGGAISLLKGGVEYLSRVSEVCQWVDVAAFITAADRMREALKQLRTENMAALDSSLIPVLKVVD
jgi:predicted metal-dependent hydrolase